MTWMLVDLLRRWAREKRPYLSGDGIRFLGYAEVHSLAAEQAARLGALGCAESNVVLLASNDVETVIAYWSLAIARATIILADARTPDQELSRIIDASDARWLVRGRDDRARQMEPLATRLGVGLLEYPGPHVGAPPAQGRRARRNGGEIAVMIPTSGTTAVPRLVMLTHENLAANAAGHAQAVGLCGHDIAAVALPLCYSYAHTAQLLGQTLVGGALLLYRQPVVLPRPLCELMARGRGTVTALVPPLVRLLSKYPHLAHHDLSRLRLLSFGGAPPPLDALAALRAALPTTEFVHTYGLAEASPRVTTLRGSDIAKLPSIGKPLPGVEVVIADRNAAPVARGEIGELWIRGANVMAGYYGAAGSDAIRDGWLRTGDLGRLDEDGYLYLTGRASNVILTGGMRVSPEEIEAVLLTYPGVKDAIVKAAPSLDLGEVPVALLSLEAGACISLERLHAFLRGKIAASKWPCSIEIRQDLQRTHSGKTRRL